VIGIGLILLVAYIYARMVWK